MRAAHGTIALRAVTARASFCGCTAGRVHSRQRIQERQYRRRLRCRGRGCGADDFRRGRRAGEMPNVLSLVRLESAMLNTMAPVDQYLKISPLIR